MGKVKDGIAGDCEALTEWVFRKLRNHDPMSERDKLKGVRRQQITADARIVHYELTDGRQFEIEVRQVRGPYIDQEVA